MQSGVLHFIFPAHPLRKASVDPMFHDQQRAFDKAGFSTSTIPDPSDRASCQPKAIPAGVKVVYRGWMLNTADYGRLSQAVTDVPASMFTTHCEYLAAHHLPNWYLLLAEHTPETVVFPVDADLAKELKSLGWGAYFIKDYVKSVKTSAGSLIHDPSEIDRVVDDMLIYRGEIEGGYCVRRVEPFVQDTEQRYFVIQGKAYAPVGSAIPELVYLAAERITAPFFSVDVVMREDGVMRLVEIGDGQVSDLVGWTPSDFVEMWRAFDRRVKPAG